MKNIKYYLILLTAASLPSFAAALPVIDEGHLMDGTTGVIRKVANVDVWNFTPETPVSAGEETWPANQPINLLPCAVLEQVTGLAGESGEITVRLWGLFTEYKQKNYLYCVYFLPIQQTPEPAEPEPDSARPKTDEDKDDSIIPMDILRQIKANQAPDLQKFQQVAVVTGDINLIGRTGYLEQKNNVLYFQPNAFGQNVNRQAYRLLPCDMLEATEKQLLKSPGRQRFEISGLVTQYKGRQYMLLRRAVRTYTNGNFTP
jgi:hypothetical protein